MKLRREMKYRRRRRVAVVLAGLAAFGLGQAWTAALAGINDGPLLVCEAIRDGVRPYAPLTVEADGGYIEYEPQLGPLYTKGAQTWGDIVPPIREYPEGLNWTERGFIIHAQGCLIHATPSPPPSSPPPSSPPPSSPPPTTVPPTTEPPTTEPPTTPPDSPSEPPTRPDDPRTPRNPDGPPTARTGPEDAPIAAAAALLAAGLGALYVARRRTA